MKSALTLTLAITLTALPVIATSLPGGLVQDVVNTRLDQTVEDRVQRSVERSASDAIDNSVEQSVTDSIDESVSESVGQSVEHSLVDTVTNSVDSRVGDTVENSVGAAVEDTVGQAVSEVTAESVAQGVQGRVQGAVDGSLEQAVSRTLNDGLSDTLQVVGDTVGNTLETVTDGVTGNILPTLPETVAVLGKSGETVFLDVEVENGWRAVQREWLLMIDNDDFPLLDKPGIRVLERTRFDQLGMSLVRFRVEAELDSRSVLDKLLPEGRDWQLERNHIYNYRPQSDASSSSGSPARSAPVCEAPVTIGMVDTAVNSGHGFFPSAITQRNFLDDRITAPQQHGTAVAGILVGSGEELQPLVPNAALSVAAVMYQREDGSQGATVMGLLAALDWLAVEGVSVINLSLAGPPNPLLEKALIALHDKGSIVIAAVGNEGPAAPALYPAAYVTVIGATAVDSERRIYRWANRGEQVDFAARGVAVKTIGADGRVVFESGTSMATAVVSAFAACLHATSNSPAVIEPLAGRAIDLGEPGRDMVFGMGFLE